MSDQKSETEKKLGPAMTDKEIQMCAHITCFCSVPIGEEFCCDSCRDAGSDDVEQACKCDHPACPLAIRSLSMLFGIERNR